MDQDGSRLLCRIQIMILKLLEITWNRSMKKVIANKVAYFSD